MDLCPLGFYPLQEPGDNGDGIATTPVPNSVLASVCLFDTGVSVAPTITALSESKAHDNVMSVPIRHLCRRAFQIADRTLVCGYGKNWPPRGKLAGARLVC